VSPIILNRSDAKKFGREFGCLVEAALRTALDSRIVPGQPIFKGMAIDGHGYIGFWLHPEFTLSDVTHRTIRKVLQGYTRDRVIFKKEHCCYILRLAFTIQSSAPDYGYGRATIQESVAA
jgi:hypothetical protein